MARTKSEGPKKDCAISIRLLREDYEKANKLAAEEMLSMPRFIEKLIRNYKQVAEDSRDDINIDGLKAESEESGIDLLVFKTDMLHKEDLSTNKAMMKYSFKGKVLWASRNFKQGTVAPDGGAEAVAAEFGINDPEAASAYEYFSRHSLFDNYDLGKKMILQEFTLRDSRTGSQAINVSRIMIVKDFTDLSKDVFLKYVNIVDKLGIERAMSITIDKEKAEEILGSFF